MIIIAILVSFAGLVCLCWLLFHLTGAGPLCAILAGIAPAALVLATGKAILVHTTHHKLRALTLLTFVQPAIFPASRSRMASPCTPYHRPPGSSFSQLLAASLSE